jgi:putative transposase
MKTERTDRQIYHTRDEARADVFGFIELFYNPAGGIRCLPEPVGV